MYCSHCGKELKEGARFCSSCGYPVHVADSRDERSPKAVSGQRKNAESHVQPPGTTQQRHQDAPIPDEIQQKSPWGITQSAAVQERQSIRENVPQKFAPTGQKRKKRVLFATVAVALLVCIGIGVFFGIREYQYRGTLSAAENALAERNYDEAITLIEALIQMRPERTDSYLMLAQAHLELENLYDAKQALENGYEVTGNEALQNVSLWGPISSFEMALWASESLPLTRQEYYFGNTDFVEGYIRAYGNIMFVMNYYFDGIGNVIHVAMTDYTISLPGVGGVNRTLWETGWPFMGEPDASWDYIYDADGNIISAEANSDAITISNESEDSVVLGDDDDRIIVQYSDDGRPTRIALYDGTRYDFDYREDGSCVAEYSEADYWYEFDKDGLFTALIGEDADAFTLKLDSQNRVESVELEDNSYQYSYSEAGYLVRVAVCDDNGEVEFYEDLSYDDSGNLIQIIYHQDQENISNYQMEYDDIGMLIKVTISDRNQNILQDTVYEYEQDGRLDCYVTRHYTISEEADDIIMVYVPVYDEYGVIVDYTLGEAVYEPGTYTGSADGFGGEVTVEVTVDYMQITNVEVLEQNETAGIGPQAFDALISKMLDSGSPNVDSVTGATISSRAFLDAVDNALRQAMLHPEDSQTYPEAIFDDLDGKTFTLSSGVGNWHTDITFDEGGLFQGTYYDLDMGDSSADYPNGTCYVAGFNGTMGNVEQIDEYTYSMEIVDLFLDVLVDGQEITDGVRYVEAKYDIEYGDVFELYCPGRNTADLPEEFMTWLRMPLAWEEDPEVLPVYGLFNLRNGDGFFCSDN